MLQSIGMTGKQLKTMLVYEGLLYAWGGGDLPGADPDFRPGGFKAVGSMFWFFTYRLTLTPFLIVAPVFALLGVLGSPGGVPLHLQTHRGGAPAGVGQLTKPYNGQLLRLCGGAVPLYISP